LFGLGEVDELSVFGFDTVKVFFSVSHYFHDAIQSVDSFSVFFNVNISMYGLGVLSFDPLLVLVENLVDVMVLLFGGYFSPLR
jgi:hypothetical protein